MSEEKITRDDVGKISVEELFGVAAPIKYTCSECGFDQTGAIEDVPIDGEEHEVVCPYCERVTQVRRTPPEEEAAPEEETASEEE